jgi:hypothetical protein
MVPPTHMTLTLPTQEHHNLRRRSDLRRMPAALPPRAGRLQRVALRLAGWGRRPAVVAGRPVRLVPALEPTAL